MSCPKCGTAYTGPNAKFCLKCGAKATGAAASTTSTTSSSTPSTSSSTTQPSTPSKPVTSQAAPSTPTMTHGSPAKAPMSPAAHHEKRLDACHCTGCGGIIVGAIVDVDQGKTGKYHPNCFCCAYCKTPITSSYTLNLDNKVLCEPCARKEMEIGEGGDTCGVCGKDIDGPTVITKGMKYHQGCFFCSKCRADLNTVAFLPADDGSLQCKTCVLTARGDVCTVCNKLIEKNGLLASDKRYHPECFNCVHCKTNLAKLGTYVSDPTGPACPDCSRARKEKEHKPASTPSTSSTSSTPSTPSTSTSASSNKPKFCGECGTSLGGSQKFCSECGARVPA